MAKIYTKVGDHGQTALVGGQKIAKSDLRIHSYGTIDELNSTIGLARAAIDETLRHFGLDESSGSDRIIQGFSRLNTDLEEIQNRLFDLGSLLASNPEDRTKYGLAEIEDSQVAFLEERIDSATAVLPPLRNFILPSGSEPACRLHMARTVARRAERAIVAVEPQESLPKNAIVFVNRLSDYLFVMARLVNHLLGFEDVLWKKK